MKKISKLTFVLISGALLSGALIACGNNNGGDKSQAGDETAIKEIRAKSYTETYKEGDSVKKSDIKLEIVYNDGTTSSVRSSSFTISATEALKASDTKIVVTYVDENEKEWTLELPITVSALSALTVTGFPTDAEQPATVTYETIFANVTVTGQWGELSEEVKNYTIFDNNAEVENAKSVLSGGDHVIKVGLGSLFATTTYSFSVVTIKDLEVEADLNSVYLDSTTWQDIHNAIDVKAVYSATQKEAYDNFELYDGDTLVADLEAQLTAGTHAIKVKIPGLDKSKDFTITVREQSAALVVEAESIVTAAPTDASVKGYTMARTSYDGDYVAISDSNTQPWCLESTNSASGKANVGSTAAGYVMEWHFYAEKAGKAVPQLRAASCWLKEDNGSWDPRWMGDIVLSELFTAEINGSPFTIPSNKVLKGSGFKGNQNAGVATWYSWNTAEFGEIDVNQGWNVFTMKFKLTSELQQLPVDADTGATKYVNCHNSYTLMNIDCMNIFFL